MARGAPRKGDVTLLSGRGPAAKLVIYPEAWARVRLGMALGLGNLAQVVWDAASARAPKDRPLMYRTGGAGAYLDGKKVYGVGPGSSSETAGAKPTAFASFEFPAHLVELGTTDTPAEPFLVPAALSLVGQAQGAVAKGMKEAGI